MLGQLARPQVASDEETRHYYGLAVRSAAARQAARHARSGREERRPERRATRASSARAPSQPGGVGPPWLAAAPHRALAVANGVAMQDDLVGAAAVIRRGVAQLTASARVYCLFRDPGSGTLWSLDDDSPGPRPADHPGVTTFAARTGAPLAAARADDSPLYRPELDDPAGDGTERILVQPIASGAAVIAVIAAVRCADAPPYSPAERLAAATLADACGPILLELALGDGRTSGSAEPTGDEEDRSLPASAGRLRARIGTRSLSMERRTASLPVLDGSPRWVRWGFVLVVAAVAAGIPLAALISITSYAVGPAVVRTGGHRVVASESGIVSSVRVKAGDRIRAGDLLVELDAGRDQPLALSPPGESAERRPAGADGQRETAPGQRAGGLRAPRDGIAIDVRVGPGMPLAPGDHVLTIADQAALPAIVALLPATARRRLAKGMEIRFAPAGHARAEMRGVIEEVGDRRIAPHEANRILGRAPGDAPAVAAPVVVVVARLSERAFDDRQIHFVHDGMRGAGAAPTRSRSALSLLVPRGDRR